MQTGVGERHHCSEHPIRLVPPREHFVLVAGQLEALPPALQPHNGDIGQPDLVGRGVDLHRHGGGLVRKLS